MTRKPAVVNKADYRPMNLRALGQRLPTYLSAHRGRHRLQIDMQLRPS